MRFDPRSIRHITFAVLLGVLPGCVYSNGNWFARKEAGPRPDIQLVADKSNWLKKKPVAKADSVAKRESNVAVRKVALDGQGKVLGEADDNTLTTAAFAFHLKGLIEESHSGADCFTRRYPDVAQRFLHENLTSEKPAFELLMFVAKAHDKQTQTRNSVWQSAVNEMKIQPARFREFAAARRQIHAALTEGKPLPKTKPLTELLPKNVNPAWWFDAWSLTGMLSLLDEKPQDAGYAFYKSIEVSRDSMPYAAMQAELLASECLRRHGSVELAAEVWQSAVTHGAEFLLSELPLIDASFWDRACYLRPHQAQWPERVAHATLVEHQRRGWFGISLQKSDVQLTGDFAEGATETPDCLIWSLLGYARFDRDEPQAALVAFKKAESLALDGAHADVWQIAQARALLRLGQTAPATAILMKHAQNKDQRASLPALALLGTIKLQANQPTIGLSLLRRAFETFPDATWPGQAEARADLGLAYLMVGDEHSGIQELHAAQRHFEAVGEMSLLLTALQNELAYSEKKSHRKEAKAIRERIEELGSN